MKRFIKSLANLSLFQQLTMIIITVGVFFALFMTIYIKGNISDFVTSQVMALLERSQQAVITNLEAGNTNYTLYTYEADVKHYVYKNDHLQPYSSTISTYTMAQFLNEKVIAHATSDGFVEGVGEVDGSKIYYAINSVKGGLEVMSVVGQNYASSVENTLTTTLTNITSLVFAVLFLLLIIWVSMIIYPIQQMRSFVDQVRKGNDEAKLNIDRRDEIGELATALVSMRDEIKDQEETKEELIHNISHDLKTPIATIKSYAESIKDGIYPYDTLDKSVDVIIENADRLENKVYSLLFLNRLDYMMDQEKNTDKETDMYKVVNDVLLSLKMIRPEIQIDKFMEHTSFKGDPESWRVVISNLVDNALRYAESYIVVSLQQYSFSISNDGPSLSADRMSKLFKPFEKGNKGNFGLGLSICYKVCNAYGYTIDAENLEKGVIFRIVADEIPHSKKKTISRRNEKNTEE